MCFIFILLATFLLLFSSSTDKSRTFYSPVKDELVGLNTSWDYGDGSINNPYVLQNKTFYGGSGNGFSLSYEDFYFIIRNCTFIGSGTDDDNAGIHLNSVQNGTITNCTFTDCQNGIFMYGFSCQNIKVNDSRFIDNKYGVIIRGSAQYIEITYNYFESYFSSIELWYERNYIAFNTMRSQSIGIYLGAGGSNNKIMNNIISQSTHAGIFLSGYYNELINNTITQNNVGIVLDDSRGNLIEKNRIESNSDTGLWVQGVVPDNLVYQNQFISNGKQAHFTKSVQVIVGLDNGSIGNYWGDYDGYDCNNDGIGETPYNTSYGNPVYIDQIDHYPICTREDTIAPVIIILSLANLAEFRSTPPTFVVNITEYLLEKTWYSLDGGQNTYEFNGTTHEIDQTLWDSLPHGIYELNISARDVAGNVGSESIQIIKLDDSSPAIPFGFTFLGVFTCSVILLYVAIIKGKKYIVRNFNWNASN